MRPFPTPVALASYCNLATQGHLILEYWPDECQDYQAVLAGYLVMHPEPPVNHWESFSETLGITKVLAGYLVIHLDHLVDH